MFVMRASRWLAALRHYRPDIAQATEAAWAGRKSDGTFVRPDKAVFAANMWISAFSAASVEKLAKYSAMPFLAGTQPAALNRAELSEMYSGLLVESGALKEWKLLTAQEYLGSGGAALKLEDTDVVLVVRAASERFAIVLRRAAGGDYRATVLIR